MDWENILVNLGLQGVVAAAVVTTAQFVAPKAWERYSDQLKKRDEFIKGTTAQVVELSKTHYWALANAAGTAGDLLAEHLRSVQLHLIVSYAGPGLSKQEAAAALRDNIDRLCNEHADQSFPSIVRLIVLFDRFQFSGSQTYLLPDHAAGTGLRRLYNQFVAALPEGGFTSDIRQAVERHLAGEKKWESGATPLGLEGTFLVDKRKLDALRLEEARKRYARWLRDSVVNVADAADALRAYAELLSHELAELNRVFFRDRGRARTTGEFGVDAMAASHWSGALTESSLLTLQRAGAESEFYRPLGGISGGGGAAGDRDEHVRRTRAKGDGSPRPTGSPPPPKPDPVNPGATAAVGQPSVAKDAAAAATASPP